MVLLEAAVVVAALGLLVYGTMIVLMRPRDERPLALRPGRWQVAHYEADHATRVVVQKVDPTTSAVLDEHVVEVIPIQDPAYDERFLAAMSLARQRQALFESEE